MSRDHRVHRLLVVEELEARIAPSGLASSSGDADEGIGEQSLQIFGVMPASFVENRGQIPDEDVRFIFQGANANVLFTDNGPVFQVFETEGEEEDSLVHASVFSATFVGAREVSPVGRDELPGSVNYFVGAESSEWRSNLSTFATVAYEGLYEGVDLYTSGSRTSLKYEFHVAPGTSTDQIVIRYAGIEGLSIGEDGALHVGTSLGEVVDDAPYIYQEINGERIEIAGRYRLIDNCSYGFEITEPYDSSSTLVIDPDLAWSTFLGGAGGAEERGYAVVVDDSGNAYIVGHTYASDFPTTPGAFDGSYEGYREAFVAKISADGTTLEYSTFLGGSGLAYGRGIAVDGDGSAYVTGYTDSSDFPTTGGAYDTSHNGNYDVFITKLSADGSSLVYSTFLGDTSSEYGRDIVIDDSGYAYIAGETYSVGFPTTLGAYQTSRAGGWDVFAAKIAPDGSDLIYSTFIGGSSNDYGYGIDIDAGGSAYVAGYTLSGNFPTTPGARDTTHNGSEDVFVTKLSADGSSLAYSTFLGGSGSDYGRDIVVDDGGFAYVTGETLSSGFPTTPGAYQESHRGGRDVFITKLAADGSDLIYSTFLGGTSQDYGEGIEIDGSGSAYVAGYTYSTNFPTTAGAYATSRAGTYDAIVAKLNADGSDLIYSTYVGGIIDDYAYGIDVDSSGNSYIVGATRSGDYPVTPGVIDVEFSGGLDVFLTKLNVNGTDLAYSTLLGGTDAGEDYPHAIAVDDAGSAYVTGYTYSMEFPTTPGAYDMEFSGAADVFVVKLSAEGDSVLYATYLGGGHLDWAFGIAADDSGCAYIAGYTESADFPTTFDAYDTVYSGNRDAFVTKLSADGAALVYSTFLGGSSSDYGRGIVVDAGGFAYVTGYTYSSTFPTTPGVYQTSRAGSGDAFVTKLSPDGNTLAYSTFLGGTSSEYAYGIEIDGDGNAFVVGDTYSFNFPTTPGAYQTSYIGSRDVFVSKLNTDATDLVYSTYLGGSNYDYGYAIDIDTEGSAYVAGYTISSNFPTTPGAYDISLNGSYDVFVTKLAVDGSGLVYSTFLGGNNTDYGYGIVVNNAGQAYVVGRGFGNFPTTDDAYDSSYGTGGDVFLTRLSEDGASLLYSTYLGGSGVESGTGIALHSIDFIYITGYTFRADFPTTPGAYDTTFNGQRDVFVAKFDFPMLFEMNLQVGLDTGLSQTDNITSTTDLIYDVTIDRAGTLEFDWDGDGDYDDQIANVAMGGTYTFSSPLNPYAEGTYNIGVLFSSLVSLHVPTTVDTSTAVPSAPDLDPASDSGTSDSDNITNVSTPVISGAGAEADAEIEVFVGGAGVGTTIVDSVGNWSFNFGTDGYINRREWAKIVSGSSSEYSESVSIDVDGNLIIAGRFYGTVDFDPGPDEDLHTSVGDADISITRINADGTYAWTKTVGGTGYDWTDAVATDDQGDILIAGYFEGTVDFDPGAPVDSRTSNGDDDIFVMKLYADGSYAWARTIGRVGEDRARGVAVDSSDNVFVCGSFMDIVDFDPSETATDFRESAGGRDIFLLKLDGEGDYQWAYTTGGTGTERSLGCATDGDDNAFLTGWFWYTVDFDPANPGTETRTSNGSSDNFITKLDSAGGHLWTAAFGGSSSENLYAVATDLAGNVLVTGSIRETVDFDPSPGEEFRTSNGESDIFVAEYSSTGDLLWVQTFGGADTDYGRGIAADPDGNVFAVGSFTDTVDFDPGLPENIWTTGTDANSYMSKFAPDGTYLWANVFISDRTGNARAAACDLSGNAYVAGFFGSTVDFDPGYGTDFRSTPTGGSDAYVLKFGPDSPSSPLGEGAHEITVKQTDLAGNPSDFSEGLLVTIDTISPTAAMPLDGTVVDLDPVEKQILVNSAQPIFTIQLDDGSGNGIDDGSVMASTVLVTKDSIELEEGTDYELSYNDVTDQIALTSLGGSFTDGVYEITISEAGTTDIITDNAGNALVDPTFTVTIDTMGPSVTGSTPTAGEYLAMPPTQVIFDFSEDMDWTSLTTDDIVFTGPGGVLAIDGFTTPTSTQLAVDISVTLPGAYALTIGPAITDMAGNEMNQNGLPPSGEEPDDSYTAQFILKPYRIVELADGQVILYDTDAPSVEDSDVDESDIVVKLNRDGSINCVTIVGNPTGFGMIVHSSSDLAISIMDKRNPRAVGPLEDISFMAYCSSAKKVCANSGVTGWDIGQLMVDEPTLPVANPDLDGDGATDELTALYCGGPVKLVKALGGVGGDLVVKGADPQKNIAVGKLDIRYGDVLGEIVTLDGGLKCFNLCGGDFKGKAIVNGALDKMKVKAMKDKATGQLVGGAIDGADILANGYLKVLCADEINNTLIAATGAGKVTVKRNLTQSLIHAGGTVDRNLQWTEGHGSVKGVTVRGDMVDSSVTAGVWLGDNVQWDHDVVGADADTVCTLPGSSVISKVCVKGTVTWTGRCGILAATDVLGVQAKGNGWKLKSTDLPWPDNNYPANSGFLIDKHGQWL